LSRLTATSLPTRNAQDCIELHSPLTRKRRARQTEICLLLPAHDRNCPSGREAM
jgi:hypothetical protein